VGVLGFSWLATRLGWASLPQGVGWGAMAGVGLLAGIGFTMSLFIGTLASEGSEVLDQAKLGILAASVVAAVAGLALVARIGSSGDKDAGGS
jgi:NhaA family Na+:H+ antiporter